MPPAVLLDIYKPSDNDKTVRLLIYYSFFLLFYIFYWKYKLERQVQSGVIIIIGVHFLIIIEVLASPDPGRAQAGGGE